MHMTYKRSIKYSSIIYYIYLTKNKKSILIKLYRFFNHVHTIRIKIKIILI